MKNIEAVVRLLIGRDDVDVNIKDNCGWTPLHVAAHNRHEAVVRLLNDRHDRVKRCKTEASTKGGFSSLSLSYA